MKKILLLLTVLLFTMGVRAQKDIVSMADAIKIFQAKTLQVGKQVLEKQGYSYKGVSSDEFGKDYNWVKNMNLTSDFLPTTMKMARRFISMSLTVLPLRACRHRWKRWDMTWVMLWRETRLRWFVRRIISQQLAFWPSSSHFLTVCRLPSKRKRQ